MAFSSHALCSSSANVRSALPLRKRGTAFPHTRHSEHWHIQKETEYVFILKILFNSLLKFYFVLLVVIGLVGRCCKPHSSVIIIIIIIKLSHIINTDRAFYGEHGKLIVRALNSPHFSSSKFSVSAFFNFLKLYQSMLVEWVESIIPHFPSPSPPLSWHLVQCVHDWSTVISLSLSCASSLCPQHAAIIPCSFALPIQSRHQTLSDDRRGHIKCKSLHEFWQFCTYFSLFATFKCMRIIVYEC